MESLWKRDYIVCKDNRTIAVKSCSDGVFDPYNRECIKGKILHFLSMFYSVKQSAGFIA
jgi:hypothetical protein